MANETSNRSEGWIKNAGTRAVSQTDNQGGDYLRAERQGKLAHHGIGEQWRHKQPGQELIAEQQDQREAKAGRRVPWSDPE